MKKSHLPPLVTSYFALNPLLLLLRISNSLTHNLAKQQTGTEQCVSIGGDGPQTNFFFFF